MLRSFSKGVFSYRSKSFACRLDGTAIQVLSIANVRTYLCMPCHSAVICLVIAPMDFRGPMDFHALPRYDLCFPA